MTRKRSVRELKQLIQQNEATRREHDIVDEAREMALQRLENEWYDLQQELMGITDEVPELVRDMKWMRRQFSRQQKRA